MGWGGGDFILGRAIPDPCPHKGRGDPEERPSGPELPSPAAGGPAGGHSPGAAASPGRAAARCLSPAHPTPAARWGSLAVVVQSAVKASVTLNIPQFSKKSMAAAFSWGTSCPFGVVWCRSVWVRGVRAVSGLGAVACSSDLFLPRELPSGGGWHPRPSASPAPGPAAIRKAFHRYLLDVPHYFSDVQIVIAR